MSTTFATNLAAPTSAAPPFPLTVSMHPSQGSTPNNSNIVIDLAALGASLPYDPSGSEPNLLVDVTLPFGPTISGPAGIMAMQDATGGVAVVRGAGVVGTASGSAGAYDSPLVMAVEFTGGTGGHALLVPARNETYGAACGGSPASFYQTFVKGQSFDLTGLRMTPDSVLAPSRYTVTGTADPIDLTKVGAVPISTGDEAIVPVSLGFALRLPGQSLNAVRASTKVSTSRRTTTSGTAYGMPASTTLRANARSTLRIAVTASTITPMSTIFPTTSASGWWSSPRAFCTRQRLRFTAA